jgi:hypothetical protein
MTITPFRQETHAPVQALPPGRWHGRLWVSEGPLADPSRYLTCVKEYDRSRLWPLLVPLDLRFAVNGEDWIDDRGKLAPAGDRIGAFDPAETLDRWWDGSCCDGACLRPYGTRFPGLARRTVRRADPLAEAGNTGSVLAARGHYRLGLVECERPADIPALLGWTGMIKTTDQVAALSAVLRSWEDRFGATLAVLGFDELELSVAAPPRGQARALAVAAEHRAFSQPTFANQPGNLREYAGGLMHARHWRFSWA